VIFGIFGIFGRYPLIDPPIFLIPPIPIYVGRRGGYDNMPIRIIIIIYI